jgi:hypothetical protein
MVVVGITLVVGRMVVVGITLVVGRTVVVGIVVVGAQFLWQARHVFPWEAPAKLSLIRSHCPGFAGG